MLYTSENSSLAYLENLVHFDESIVPADLFIIRLEITAKGQLIYRLPLSEYTDNWQALENPENKRQGDRWMNEKKYLAIKVLSAINPAECNYLLNPLFPGFHDMVKVRSFEKLPVDPRLIR